MAACKKKRDAMLEITNRWVAEHTGAMVGLLLLQGVQNPPYCATLETAKRAIEAQLRAQYNSKTALSEHPVLAKYADYYKRFKKTYHVCHQLESVIFKNKNLPTSAALVESMFVAELKNGLLTAGHDFSALQGPLRLDSGTGTESYVLINGKEQLVKSGDMYIADSLGVLSSIIHGPDFRTRITATTQTVLYTVYAPPGFNQQTLLNHLTDIHDYTKLISPGAKAVRKELVPAASTQ